MERLKLRMNMKEARQYLLIVLGCAIAACAYPLMLEPHRIAPGGFTGIATVLHSVFKLPIGLTSLALNIPLLLIGWKHIGARFILKTVLATLVFSLMIDLIKLPALSEDPLLSAVFGGALLGFGLGLILKGNATTGGTDLLARIVHHRFRAISVGTFLLLFDLMVVVLAWAVLGASSALYAIICVYVTTKVLDQVLIGIGVDKACYVISKQHHIIAERIMQELDRGVTTLSGRGAFSGKDIQILLCVVGRLEAVKVKDIVKDLDPDAFMFITDTHETLGEGFKQLTGEDI